MRLCYMYFKEERINRILKEIKNCIHTDRHEINNLQVRFGEKKKNTVSKIQ